MPESMHLSRPMLMPQGGVVSERRARERPDDPTKHRFRRFLRPAKSQFARPLRSIASEFPFQSRYVETDPIKKEFADYRVS